MTTFVQTVVDALAVGSVYALFGLGISLVFGVMRLVNFAYAALISCAGFALVLFQGVPTAVGLVGVVLATALLAMAMERLAFRPLRGAPEVTLLIASFAVNTLVLGVILSFAGTAPSGVELPFLAGSITLGSLQFAVIDLATILVTLALLAALVAFLSRTPLGLHMRAAAEDLVMARLLGVRANAVVLSSFAISGVLAATAGILMVGRTGSVTVSMGLTGVLYGFVAAVIGSLGSLGGAVIAGYLLGATSALLQVILPESLVGYRDAILFALVFAFIVFVPKGLSPAVERV
jgi:branched-chain amino acid transport system permease protein